MNYPIWDVPASGLLIAAVAILHVFISHFAVGGGLFLVLTERRARQGRDYALLGYVRMHSRFFAVLTLVVGAITGVGIWFTIGLVHPEATASLIDTFVWLWAIEWTMFATEIAAAMVYYYGWDRLTARAHLAVGWIYFWAAWLSLVVINGILSFMLTPGAWLTSRRVLDGYANPTFLPSVVGRTIAAVGLAGLYALLTSAWLRDPDLKARVARDAGLRWVVPTAVALPFALAWYVAAASGSGIPVGEILGARGDALTARVAALVNPAVTGYPAAQRAAVVALAGATAALLTTLAIVALRPKAYGRLAGGVLMLAGLFAIGGAEWVREDLRKPYVIGRYMFVHGVRMPPGTDLPAGTPGARAALAADRYTVDALNQSGVLAATPWVRLPAAAAAQASPAEQTRAAAARGSEVFRLECTRCHTVDGYQAIRPLVRGRTAGAIDGIISQLAKPVNAAGQPASWNGPGITLVTWRGRRMPPFVGSADERGALVAYLAMLGGQSADAIAVQTGATTETGKAGFEEHCAACHGAEAEWPMGARIRGRSADQLYEVLGRLPALNAAMPAFEGTDEQRRALAAYVVTLGGATERKEGRQ